MKKNKPVLSRRKLKYHLLYLKSPRSIKFKFKVIGVFMILVAYGVIMTNKAFYFFAYDISVLMIILMTLILLIGISSLLFVSTDNFKIGFAGLSIRYYIEKKLLQNKSLQANIISFKNKIDKYPRIDLTKFKCFSELERVVNGTEKLIDLKNRGDLLGLLINKEISSESSSIICDENKILLITTHKKNIFIYDHIFDFFDEIIEDGIFALYGMDRRIFLNYIISNFTKRDGDFDYENLRKNYNKWLKQRKIKSDINFAINSPIDMSEYC